MGESDLPGGTGRPAEPPAEGPTTLETLEERKVRLEGDKLEQELASHGRPFWRKPAFWGVAIPAVVAAATLIAQIVSGYYENQLQLIAFRKERVEKSEKDLDARRNALDGAEADVAKRQKKLDDAGRHNQALFEETERMRKGLDEDRARLAEERADIAEQRTKIAEQLKEIEASGEISKLRAWMELLEDQRETGGALVQNDAVESIESLLKAADGDTRSRAIAELERWRSDEAMNALVVRILRRVGSDAADLDSMLASFDHAADLPRQFWYTVVYGRWDDEALVRILGRAIPHVAELDDERRGFLFSAISDIEGDVLEELQPDIDEHRVVPLAVELALDAEGGDWDRVHAVAALANLEPEAALAIAAHLLADPGTPRFLFDQIEDLLVEPEFYGDFEKALAQLGSPLDEPRAWLEAHPDLASTWVSQTGDGF